VFLLSSALSDTIDDELVGDRYDFSDAVSVFPLLRGPAALVGLALDAWGRHRTWRLRPLRFWRERWRTAVDRFLQAWIAPNGKEAEPLARACADMAALLASPAWPARLVRRRVKVPAAFRTQDLSHHDVLELADRFAAAFPERRRPLLVVGLRTAGSYFAPLLRAALFARGFEDARSVTLRPKKGFAAWERAELSWCAAHEGMALLVDEPADTGSTLSKVVARLRSAGVPPGRIVALFPVHPTRREWHRAYESLPLADIHVLSLAPEDWHKQRLLDSGAFEPVLQGYFRARGYAGARLGDAASASDFNRQLERTSEQKFHTRLKRVFEVRLLKRDGAEETRYVLAKSVGWGWLGYHAFLAGEALSEFVPPLLGLREGILFTEWLPQTEAAATAEDRSRLLRRLAAYVAARVRLLGLPADPTPELSRHNQKGVELLAGVLSRAYGWKPAAVLRRARLRHRLCLRPCSVPTLIDGKMRPLEWVRAGSDWLKADFEHHALGKTELNVTDPAYDLADAILHFSLSPAEEDALVAWYAEATGDDGVGERLFLHKLLAGTSALGAALDNLDDARLSHRAEDWNRSYLAARNFLTLHTARLCGRLAGAPASVRWGSPLVVMDIDGVLDKQIFGFPSTTAAGIRALALFHAHGTSLALNTARSLAEVQEYARAYGCAGGVAEYGSVVWDATTGRTRVLVTPESRAELERVAAALRALPGVFLDDSYEHSLRAYSYDRKRTVPLPMPLVHGVLADLGVKRLRLHQTFLDTAILPSEVDKGRGLLELLTLVGQGDAETIAIGDSEPDLAMFRVARRSFAPSHISGRGVAGLIGCRITDRPFQPGLLRAARQIVHLDGTDCERCRRCHTGGAGVFWDVLEAADRHPIESLLRAIADPRSRQAFVR
jgi:hydroxymethylpyrimidine pyrophosphatase-like HAD family hydrolase